MTARWTSGQVEGLAPDQSSIQAARTLATPRPWSATGCDDGAVWGDCQGSGGRTYQVIVDLPGRAYHCSCPSRKVPCKHALALLLLWAGGHIEPSQRTTAAEQWLDEHRARAEQGRQRPATTRSAPADPEAARKRAEQRAARVAAGMAELERWLTDQVRDGLAHAARLGYGHWDRMAARLVDAQASGAASMIRGMGAIPVSGADWPARLLERYALAWLLVRAHHQDADPATTATVRAHIGFTTSREELLRDTTPVRDKWLVLGSRDEIDDRLAVRRTWLRGQHTSRPALVLSFAGPGQTLDVSLAPGTQRDADLAYYPGALELRAMVVATHQIEPAREPAGESVASMLAEYANALAHDPWLNAWPVVLGSVTPTTDGAQHLVDAHGDAVPLTAGENWELVAVSGGRPIVVGGEWSPAGFRPLTAWAEGRMVEL